MHLEVDQKYYLRQKQVDGLVLPVLDSLDNYKILRSERMNVLAIYLHRRKLPVASNLSMNVKTAVYIFTYLPGMQKKKYIYIIIYNICITRGMHIVYVPSVLRYQI
jgi:hypothetical protein